MKFKKGDIIIRNKYQIGVYPGSLNSGPYTIDQIMMIGWKKEDRLDEVWGYELEEIKNPPKIIIYPETNLDDYFDLDIIRMRKVKLNKIVNEIQKR